MANPENITKPMTYEEFLAVFKTMALYKFDEDRAQKMAGLYYQAVRGFSLAVWKEVCMEFALSTEREFPKAGYFRGRCEGILAGKTQRPEKEKYTDAECYSPAALKARSAFFKKVNDMASRTQPGPGTFLRALNSAVTEQVEAMVRSVERDEHALEAKVKDQPDKVKEIARALA